MNTKKNLLSICCLGYNHSKFIKENLDSIAKINYSNIEVIVVDDGSQDDSVELLNNIKDLYPFDIKIIAQKNSGNIGKNFNNAWKVAKGELITFISLDDVFNPDVVLEEIKTMNTQANLAFVASAKAIAIDNHGFIKKSCQSLPTENKLHLSIDDLLEFEYNDFGSFYIQGAIFRKSIVDDIGCFDEDMTGDDIVLRTKLFRYMKLNEKWDFRLINSNNVFYRMHDNNIHKNSIRQLKIVIEYLDRYWPNRENPEILIDWTCYAIRNNKLSEYAKIFTLNTRSNTLLLDKEVQDCITQSILKEKKITNYVFKKIKKNPNEREITLLNFIKFNYKKKRQSKPTTGIHYLKFNDIQ